MKVTIIHNKSGVPKKDYELYEQYIKYLQKHYPLKEKVEIHFIDKRDGNMTTGAYDNKKKEILVLSKGRMNIDIMRTLTHEWIHQYQTQILNRKKGKNIGGQNENEANAIAGVLIKKFEKGKPTYEPKMYNDNEKTSRESRTNSQSNKTRRHKG